MVSLISRQLRISRPPFPAILQLLLPLLTWTTSVSAQGDRTMSLADQPDFGKQSTCGKDCMWWSGEFWIGAQLDCSRPWLNDCFCREDKAPVISSHATSCLDRLCTAAGVVQNDINTFLSIYNSYCLANGYTLEGKGNNVVPTTPPAAGGNGGIVTVGDSTAGTVTRVTFATVTGSSRSSGSGVGPGLTTTPRMGPKTTVDITSTITVSPTAGPTGDDEGGLSRSDKIAIGIGIGIGLPATIAGLVTCCIMMVRRA